MSWRRSRAALFRVVPIALWRPLQWLGSLIGSVRWLVVQPAPVVIAVALPVATVLSIVRDWCTLATGAIAAVWLAVLTVLAIRNAKDRLIVGQFEAVQGVEGSRRDSGPLTALTVDVADLLRIEIARLADLLRIVDDRRAVSSGLTERSRLDIERDEDRLAVASGVTEQSALDATLSVDQLTEALQGTISSDAKISLGPLTISLAPFIYLIGRVLQSPRITGRLHRDGDRLILTAQVVRERSLSWRVQHDLSLAPEDPSVNSEGPVIDAMVRELALRIYTDLALDSTVRWEASAEFVEGLRRFRSCLRTPRGRRVNLRHAEQHFLEALAQDENYPSAHYNLGVLYTELLGLATAAGRNQEAGMHTSAAEASFGRAIEQASERWDCHFAFAQIQLSHGRYDAVRELCTYMLRRNPSLSQEVRTHELAARALLSANTPGALREARREARSASALALSLVVTARARRRRLHSRADQQARTNGRIAAACLLTYGTCYLSRPPAQRRPSSGVRAQQLLHRVRRTMARLSWLLLLRRVRRTMARLIWLSRLGDSRADLQHYFGRWAFGIEEWDLAEQQLSEAAGSLPTRAAFAADLALARAKRETQRRGSETLSMLNDAERAYIASPALRALQAMAGTFSPTHDASVCDTVSEVYRILGKAADIEITNELKSIGKKIRDSLASEPMSASGLFVRMSQRPAGKLAGEIGDYAKSAQRAFTLLAEARANRSNISKMRDALKEAEHATSLNPLSTFAWETLGDVHAEFADFSNARIAWTHALRTDPDNARLYDKLGLSFWNIAYEGGPVVPQVEDLHRAATQFEDALTLYGSDDLRAQMLTRSRLAKLYSALRNLDEARRHLQIVDTVRLDDLPPLVGWVMFGFACLERRAFSECEHYFRAVIAAGDELARPKSTGQRHPTAILGKYLDERRWPLSLIRAWGHLGLCLSWQERNNASDELAVQLKAAEDRLRDLYHDNEAAATHFRFPTRARAVLKEARARMILEKDVDEAITLFESAISEYPFSRTYLGLASALEQLGEQEAVHADQHRARARLLMAHAEALGRWKQPPDEAQRLLDRLAQQ
jgi:tetratricopeptide (TPR) repeat protein